MSIYRSDVIGSLLRPEYLKQARERHEKGELADADFKKIEDRAVNEAIELQLRAGLDVGGRSPEFGLRQFRAVHSRQDEFR